MLGSSGKLFPVLASIIRLLLALCRRQLRVGHSAVYLPPRGDVIITPQSSGRKKLLMRYNSGTVAFTPASHPMYRYARDWTIHERPFHLSHLAEATAHRARADPGGS